MRLLLITEIPVRVEVITGLHIGAGRDTLKIGDIDNPVVKLALKDDQPYIPGSSLKGKLRSLLELKLGKVEGSNEHKFQYDDCVENARLVCDICKYFGVAGDVDKQLQDEGGKRPLQDFLLGRFIFRDLELDDESQRKFREAQEDPYMGFYEEKKETAIDRRTGRARSGSLRTTERVPAGVVFEGSVGLRVFDTDLVEGVEEYINQLKNLLRRLEELLNNDYLGGSGTRGYGRVKLEFDTDKLEELKEKLRGLLN